MRQRTDYYFEGVCMARSYQVVEPYYYIEIVPR
jgi:hypothetical protein